MIYKLLVFFTLLSCDMSPKVYLNKGLVTLRSSVRNHSDSDKAMIAYGNLLAEEINHVDLSEQEIAMIIEGFEAGMRNKTFQVTALDSSKFLNDFSTLLESRYDKELTERLFASKKDFELKKKMGKYLQVQGNILVDVLKSGEDLKDQDFYLKLTSLSQDFPDYEFLVNKKMFNENIQKVLELTGVGGVTKVFSQLNALDFLEFGDKKQFLYSEYLLKTSFI